jgi:Ran-interacting Mog1 protein
MIERQLFGGALSCQIPADWIDVSDIRQVPDHQECWRDDGDGTSAPSLLVVEILEWQPEIANENAAAYYFQNLAEANDATGPGKAQFTQQQHQQQQEQQEPSSSLLQMIGQGQLPASAAQCFGTGYQKVAMGREFDMAGNRRHQEVHWIRIEICVIRLPHVGTDLLVTLSTPSNASLHQSNTIAATNGDVDICDEPTDLFRQIMSTLRIRDWSLFG